MVEFIEYASRDEWAEGVAGRVAARLDDAIVSRGDAQAVVSGGTTPEPMFARLAAHDLDWSRVVYTLADERWLPPDHPDRNEAIMHRALLTGAAAAATLISPGDGVGDPDAAAAAWEQALPPLQRMWDAVLLGMGDDGHTASWFPGGDSLVRALEPAGGCRALALRAEEAKHPRITLTYPEIMNSRVIMFLITGTAKLHTYQRALDDGPVEAMPSRALLRQTRVPVEVHWAP